MPSLHSLDPLLLTIYPATPPQQKRTVPMQVLCVGISRSGTESLAFALTRLGYTHCWHGFDIFLPPAYQMYAWWRLFRRKYHPRPGEDPTSHWTAADFDPLLGHCRAVTDTPAAVFAPELIQAYPDAKVILNVRRDRAAWHKSFEATIGPLTGSWLLWLAHWFSGELFWIMHVAIHGFVDGPFFRGDWRTHGIAVYDAHVQGIRSLGLPEERLLEWGVEDGWEPLCRFLGREVPDEAFPSGNTPKAFEQRIEASMKRLLKQAGVNFLLTLGATSALGVALWYALS